MYTTSSGSIRPTNMLLALTFSGCLLIGIFCTASFFITLFEGNGVQIWAIQGLVGSLVVAFIGWLIHQVDTYGWTGWRDIVRRTRIEIRIRIAEWRQ